MPDAAFSLDGELALITGGGTGPGLAIAQEFVKAGARARTVLQSIGAVGWAASRAGGPLARWSAAARPCRARSCCFPNENVASSCW
jgi:NAD(P)-dependent dehydrogenase (short-subunit alcohol dehydrogenase family)